VYVGWNGWWWVGFIGLDVILFVGGGLGVVGVDWLVVDITWGCCVWVGFVVGRVGLGLCLLVWGGWLWCCCVVFGCRRLVDFWGLFDYMCFGVGV